MKVMDVSKVNGQSITSCKIIKIDKIKSQVSAIISNVHRFYCSDKISSSIYFYCNCHTLPYSVTVGENTKPFKKLQKHVRVFASLST